MWKLAGLIIAIAFIIMVMVAGFMFMPKHTYAYDSSNVTSVDVAFENDVSISGLSDINQTIQDFDSTIYDFKNTFTGLFYIIPLLTISVLAFWKENAFLFMIAFGLAWLTGLNAPDILNGNSETTTLGLTLGLMMVAYGMFCAVMAFRLMFWESKE